MTRMRLCTQRTRLFRRPFCPLMSQRCGFCSIRWGRECVADRMKCTGVVKRRCPSSAAAAAGDRAVRHCRRPSKGRCWPRQPSTVNSRRCRRQFGRRRGCECVCALPSEWMGCRAVSTAENWAVLRTQLIRSRRRLFRGQQRRQNWAPAVVQRRRRPRPSAVVVLPQRRTPSVVVVRRRSGPSRRG